MDKGERTQDTGLDIGQGKGTKENKGWKKRGNADDADLADLKG